MDDTESKVQAMQFAMQFWDKAENVQARNIVETAKVFEAYLRGDD